MFISKKKLNCLLEERENSVSEKIYKDNYNREFQAEQEKVSNECMEKCFMLEKRVEDLEYRVRELEKIRDMVAQIGRTV